MEVSPAFGINPLQLGLHLGGVLGGAVDELAGGGLALGVVGVVAVLASLWSFVLWLLRRIGGFRLRRHRRSLEACTAAGLRRFLRTASVVVRWWSYRSFFLDLLWRGTPAGSPWGMGSFPGRRRSLQEVKISPLAASYNCGGSKSHSARCLFGTMGWCCGSSPLSTVTATDSGEERQLGHARSSLRTGLLFAFLSRGFCAKGLGQLSVHILPEFSLYLYAVSFVLSSLTYEYK